MKIKKIWFNFLCKIKIHHTYKDSVHCLKCIYCDKIKSDIH